MRLLLSAAITAICALVSTSLPASQNSGAALSNKDIVEMSAAGLSSEVLVAKIKSSKCDFETTPEALKALKGAHVPDDVILAIVQAPRKSSVYTASDAASGTAKITCLNAKDIPILSAPGVFPPIGQVACGEQVSVLEKKNPWDKVRTANGAVGYIADYFITGETEKRITGAASTPTNSSSLQPNVLHAAAWRGVPWVTTTYYQQPGSANTECTGSGTWLGNFWQANSSCTTQYTPAQTVPFNWQHYTIYNLVETSDSWMVLGCTRNWAFSKCSYLIPGSYFPFENKKGKITIRGQRAGKDKEQTLELDIVSVQSKAGL